MTAEDNTTDAIIFRALSVAREAALHAGKLVLDLRESGRLGIEQKSSDASDIVTVADKQSEALIVSAIREAFPEHGIKGEEGASEHLESDWLWSIDAIDGTLNFSRGSPDFGISVGLLHQGIPVMGAIYFPAMKDLFYASRGQGAFRNEERITIRSQRDLAHAVIGFGSGYGDRDDQTMRYYRPLAQKVFCRVALSYVADVRNVLLGYSDAYVHGAAKLHDMAASIVIAREAGCVVTGIHGELNLQQEIIDAIFATNEPLLREIQDLLSQA